MHLRSVRIFNCFGFGDTTANLEPTLVYILGRNSSGKTALLDAINSIAPERNPADHRRFENFRPTEDNPRVRATFRDMTLPETIDVTAPIQSQLTARNIPAVTITSLFTNTFAIINEHYTTLLQEIATSGTLTLTKSKGNCQLTVGEEFEQSNKRRQELDAILKRLAPGAILQNGPTRYENVNLTLSASDLDREAARQIIPRITYYDKQYSLTDDLPDHITSAEVERPPNSVTGAFLAVLNADDIRALLDTNDPDEQDRFRAVIQERANTLANTISQESSRLVAVTLSMTSHGLQITVRTDGKKSFYRQLSDATKFLIAYHIHAHGHEPGSILLFDEPSRGLHASAEQYLRAFLQRLALNNHVIVSTHSDRLIDIRHLAQHKTDAAG
jgi:energy-coupling factor transporter ATP-binding protein EcfA2